MCCLKGIFIFSIVTIIKLTDKVKLDKNLSNISLEARVRNLCWGFVFEKIGNPGSVPPKETKVFQDMSRIPQLYSLQLVHKG